MKCELSISYDINIEAILKRWQWFRNFLIEFYGLGYLPEMFEYEVSKNERVDEEDDELKYAMTPPEYNYSWDAQTLEFNEGRHKVSVMVNVDDLYSYYYFKYENDESTSQVKFFVSFKEQYLEIDENSPIKDEWVFACEGLK